MHKRVFVTGLLVILLILSLPLNVFAAEGWQKIDGKWYYLDANGRTSSGWIQDGGRWYYMGSDGAMLHGWQKLGESWYYFGWPDDPGSGAMRHGWFRDNGRWYYLGKPEANDTGAMRRGWLEVNDRWYYFGSPDDPDSGAMRSGWFKDKENWYYFGWPDDPDSGAMRTGWVQDEDSWYYMLPSGAMATGLVNTNEGVSDTPKNYLLAANGRWQEEFTGMFTGPDYKSHYIKNGLESIPNKVIYLTFDDGPSAHTDRLINILNKYNAKATFFVTGNNSRYLDSIGKAYRSGHSIGNHTYSHNYSYCYSSVSAFWADWQKTENIILAQTGQGTDMIRFPGGSSNTVSSFNPGIMSRLANNVHYYGYEYYDWNVGSGDAGGTTSTSQVYRNIVGGCAGRSWSIVLCHDTKSYTVDAIESVLIWGQNNGYVFMALDINSPTVHHRIAN